jgi:hypothetical protein
MNFKHTAPTPHKSARVTPKIITALLLLLGSLSHITIPANAASAQTKPRFVNFDSTEGTGCYKWTDQLVSSEPNLSPRLPSYLGKRATKAPCSNRHHVETFVNMDKLKFQSLGKPFSKVRKYCQKTFSAKKKNISFSDSDLQILYTNSSTGTRSYFCALLGANYVDDANTDYRVYKESIKPILKINIGR